MIPQGIVDEVRRLLAAEKLSQRTIAKVTGISRATVGAIANGKRPDYVPRQADNDFFTPNGPPERCRGCGGMVYMPCQLCRVRAIKRHAAAARRRRVARACHQGGPRPWGQSRSLTVPPRDRRGCG